jgi:hypothetical protein
MLNYSFVKGKREEPLHSLVCDLKVSHVYYIQRASETPGYFPLGCTSAIEYESAKESRSLYAPKVDLSAFSRMRGSRKISLTHGNPLCSPSNLSGPLLHSEIERARVKLPDVNPFGRTVVRFSRLPRARARAVCVPERRRLSEHIDADN